VRLEKLVAAFPGFVETNALEPAGDFPFIEIFERFVLALLAVT
jgi:hypothetical protein